MHLMKRNFKINVFRNEYVICVDNKWCFSLNSECNPGNVGLDCRELFSGHCENNEPCDHVSGVCPGKCQDEYMDEYYNTCKRLTSLFQNDLLQINVMKM